MVKVIPMEPLVASIARASEHVPAEAELGLHLCYGDPGHKHVVEPKDTKLMVEFQTSSSPRSSILLPGSICQYRVSEKMSLISHRSRD